MIFNGAISVLNRNSSFLFASRRSGRVLLLPSSVSAVGPAPAPAATLVPAVAAATAVVAARPAAGAAAAASGPVAGPLTRPGAGPGPASAAAAASEHLALLNELQSPAVQLSVVQLLQGVLHSSTLRKLDKSFALPLVVSVGVGDLPSGAEVVLQVLPRRPRGEVLDDDAVGGLLARRVAAPAGRAAAAAAESSAAAAVPEAVAPTAALAGHLHAHPSSQEILPVEIVACVVGITVVLKLDETEAGLEGDLPEGAKPLEELFHVALANVVPDVADVHACPRHYQLALTSDILSDNLWPPTKSSKPREGKK